MNEFAATSLQEQSFCRSFAAKVFTGTGKIVEFRPWLGSLTSALGEGLQQNRKVVDLKGLIEVYDRFKWDPSMEKWVKGTKLEGIYNSGDLFVDRYESQISCHKNLVNVNESDLEHETWDGEPIELLVNDAWKTLPIVQNTVTQFFPSLIPEKSYVVHQDYLWITESFIHIAMFRLRDAFEYRLRIPKSTMVVFRCVEEICDLRSFFPADFSEFSRDEIEEAFAWSQAILPPDTHHLIKAAKAWMLVQVGDDRTAKRLFREIEADRSSLDALYQHQKSVLLPHDLGRNLGLRNLPWYFFDCLMWEAKFPDEISEVTYWDPELGWLWTGRDAYPHFVRLETREWLEYEIGTYNPRRFANQVTGLDESF